MKVINVNFYKRVLYKKWRIFKHKTTNKESQKLYIH